MDKKLHELMDTEKKQQEEIDLLKNERDKRMIDY
jgi:hypothetical protein